MKTNTRQILGAMMVSALAVLLPASAAYAAAPPNVLTNGDFESEPNFGVNGDAGYTLLTGSQVPGWTIETSHGVTIHNTTLYPFISGSYSVNMDGEGVNGHNASFFQTFGSVLGATYDLSFDWKVWISSSAVLGVTIIDNTSSAVLYARNFPTNTTGMISHETAQFFGTGHTLQLRVFESTETHVNDNTFIVDNFSVSSAAVAPVPEPESLAMMLAGLAVVGAFVRRQR